MSKRKRQQAKRRKHGGPRTGDNKYALSDVAQEVTREAFRAAQTGDDSQLEALNEIAYRQSGDVVASLAEKPKTAEEVTRTVFKKMPDESPELPERERLVNVEVRRRLVADTRKTLDELVDEGKISRYEDEEGFVRFYVTDDQRVELRGASKLVGGTERAMRFEETRSMVERGMGGALANPQARADDLYRQGHGRKVEAGWSEQLLGERGHLSHPPPTTVGALYEAARRELEGTDHPGPITEMEPEGGWKRWNTKGMMETESTGREEFRVRRDDGSTKGLGGDHPIGDLVREQAGLDAAVALLKSPDLTDDEKATNLVREYMGVDAATIFAASDEEAQRGILHKVLDIAKRQRDEAGRQAEELEDRIVGAEREVRAIRQREDPVAPYRRSEVLMLKALRPSTILKWAWVGTDPAEIDAAVERARAYVGQGDTTREALRRVGADPDA